jgi:disulfide bond formation protein DsbB
VPKDLLLLPLELLVPDLEKVTLEVLFLEAYHHFVLCAHLLGEKKSGLESCALCIESRFLFLHFPTFFMALLWA